MVKVIRGQDLIQHKRQTDMVDGFAEIIDPNGWNVVVMESLHNDRPEIRLAMLFKLMNQEEPFEGILTLPLSIFSSIYKMVSDDGQFVH